MTSSPKRPWFRFHLLTALMMMVAAGAVLWISLRKNFHYESQTEHRWGLVEYGWPLTAYQLHAGVITEEEIAKHPPEAQAEARADNEWDRFYLENVGIVLVIPPGSNFVLLGLIVDALSVFTLLGITAALSESFLRRRETHKS